MDQILFYFQFLPRFIESLSGNPALRALWVIIDGYQGSSLVIVFSLSKSLSKEIIVEILFRFMVAIWILSLILISRLLVSARKKSLWVISKTDTTLIISLTNLNASNPFFVSLWWTSVKTNTDVQ